MIACQHCFSKNAADVVCVMREGSFAANSHPSPRPPEADLLSRP